MASYTTQLLDWGEQGLSYPGGYSYARDVPPIEEYDDFAMFNLIKDVKHLIGLTNKRLESSSGGSADKPASPEDGHLFWNTDTNYVEVYDSSFGGWRELAYKSSLDSHISNTSNPHGVTTGQIGASVAGHNHDGRYARLFDGVQFPEYQSVTDVPSNIGRGEVVYIIDEAKLYMENGI